MLLWQRYVLYCRLNLAWYYLQLAAQALGPRGFAENSGPLDTDSDSLWQVPFDQVRYSALESEGPLWNLFRIFSSPGRFMYLRINIFVLKFGSYHHSSWLKKDGIDDTCSMHGRDKNAHTILI